MAIEYVNRKGRKHYLHVGTTKTGKPKYFFSMKPEGTLAEAIPEGYEIYEHPNAQVFLRKTLPQVFTPEEVATVREGIQKYTKIDYFILDLKDNAIVVYLPDQDLDDLLEIANPIVISLAKAREVLSQSLNYSPMMQFVLLDDKNRSFVAYRWCFRGAVDDWIPISSSGPLKELVKTFAPHLGQESFFDLMPHRSALP